MLRGEIQSVYDEKAPLYDKSIGLTENILLGDLRRRFGDELRGETLEIAVGSGLNLPYYSDRVTQATGVDLSAGMLDQARARSAALGLTIELAQMDAELLAFADNQFDTVAISLALCTTPDAATAIREMARVCRRNGRLVFLEHVLSPNRFIAYGERVLSPMQERRLGCSLVRDTAGLLDSMGFAIEHRGDRFFRTFRLMVAGATRVE